MLFFRQIIQALFVSLELSLSLSFDFFLSLALSLLISFSLSLSSALDLPSIPTNSLTDGKYEKQELFFIK